MLASPKTVIFRTLMQKMSVVATFLFEADEKNEGNQQFQLDIVERKVRFSYQTSTFRYHTCFLSICYNFVTVIMSKKAVYNILYTTFRKTYYSEIS